MHVTIKSNEHLVDHVHVVCLSKCMSCHTDLKFMTYNSNNQSYVTMLHTVICAQMYQT
jgi:hypothetical protein